MKLQFHEHYHIPYPGNVEAALAFVRDIPTSLCRVGFIRQVVVTDGVLRAALAVPAPMVGEQLVDFISHIEHTPQGARLLAQELGGNAWAEVWGEAKVSPSATGADINYDLRVVAHLKLPLPEHWGGRTFVKMAETAAAQMLPKVAAEFPRGLAEAIALSTTLSTAATATTPQESR
jgi:hypothetical protein